MTPIETVFSQMILRVVEYAPAVAILLLLLWQNARQMNKFWDLCIKHLLGEEDDKPD